MHDWGESSHTLFPLGRKVSIQRRKWWAIVMIDHTARSREGTVSLSLSSSLNYREPPPQCLMSSVLSCNVQKAFHGVQLQEETVWKKNCTMHIFTWKASEEFSRKERKNPIYFSAEVADFTSSISNSNSQLTAATMWRSAKSIRTEQNWSVVAKGSAARRLEGYSAAD